MIKSYKETKDERILAEIFRGFEPIIHKYASRTRPAFSDDMRQELLISVWNAVEKIGDYSVNARCVCYIVSAIRHRYIYLCRAYKEQAELEELVSEIWDTIPESDLSVFEEIEFAVDLEQNMKELSQSQRKLAEYAFMQKMSDAEIARKLGVSRQYVNKEKKRIAVKINRGRTLSEDEAANRRNYTV